MTHNQGILLLKSPKSEEDIAWLLCGKKNPVGPISKEKDIRIVLKFGELKSSTVEGLAELLDATDVSKAVANVTKKA